LGFYQSFGIIAAAHLGLAEQEPRIQEVIENLKKWISLLLAGILVSSVLVGCKKDEAADTTGDTTGGTATAGTAGTTGETTK
jgi:hypothetical protein